MLKNKASMKQILATLTFCLAFFTSSVFADEGAWPRSYFVGAGFGGVASKGDIGKYNIKTTNKDNEVEIVHQPAFDIFAWPDFFIGVDIGQFSLSMNFNYWNFEETLGGMPDASTKAEVQLWRFGVEFVYNFFWPDFFQPGVGIGYAYSSITTDNSVYPVNETEKLKESELMGSSLALILNMRYYLTDNIVFQPALKLNEGWFKSLSVDGNETLELKHTKWQTFTVAELAVIYHF